MAPRTARKVSFTAKLVDKSDISKSAAQLQAEELLTRLSGDKAVEISFDGSSPRAVRSAFRKAAESLDKEIVFRRRGERLYLVLKEE